MHSQISALWLLVRLSMTLVIVSITWEEFCHLIETLGIDLAVAVNVLLAIGLCALGAVALLISDKYKRREQKPTSSTIGRKSALTSLFNSVHQERIPVDSGHSRSVNQKFLNQVVALLIFIIGCLIWVASSFTALPAAVTSFGWISILAGWAYLLKR
ncbi:MAG: hypothetical protein M3261_00650 [Thermoproteota archaeon]|nr:hypothetical protein [Thermoproteota archaeon]